MNKQLIDYANDLKTGKITRISHRDRTKIERQLYLDLNHFTLNKLEIPLDGLTDPHRKIFSDLSPDKKHTQEDLQIVINCFDLYDLLTGLSSSDPYVVIDTARELGGREKALKLLGENIEQFTSSIQDK